MNQNAKVTAKVAELTGSSKKEAEKSVTAVLEAIQSVAESEGKATFAGLGTFSYKHRPAGTARNPRTGEVVNVAAKTSLIFKASKK